jgi:hypothetical protein
MIITIELTEFENELVNSVEQFLLTYLTEMYYDSDDDFWDPVHIGVESRILNKLETVTNSSECLICSDTKLKFKKVNCCRNIICECCTAKWFSKHRRCPFCNVNLKE